jgi:hemerythrin-like domain-containing protein
MGDDPAVLQRFAEEVAPAVREAVAAERAGAAPAAADSVAASTAARPSDAPPATGDSSQAGDGAPVAGSSLPVSGAATTSAEDIDPDQEYARLGVTPTPDDGTRLTAATPWDESTRPRRTPSGPEVDYTRQGKLVGQHLIDVHDMLRRELTELRDVVEQVRSGALSAGDARSALNDMALRQNDWTLGAFCARYCGVVAQHHGLEDGAVFPHLARSDASLEPVIDRLTEEHLVIHDAIGEIDKALVAHINAPTDFDRLQAAIDYLTDALLSHLSYEEHELVEPLARLGFYPDQL